MDDDAISVAARLLDGQIDWHAGRAAAGAPKVGADLLALRACRGALARVRGGEPSPEDAAALAACSPVRARTALCAIASTWRASLDPFRHGHWTVWLPLNLLLTGPDAPGDLFGLSDPGARPPARRAARKIRKAPKGGR